MERKRTLDGLRTISVLGVFLTGYHWVLPCGWVGVLVFYVLSGFLITEILVRARAESGGAGRFFRRFYFRRTLRIFPLYFVYLFALAVTYAVLHVPESWPSVRPFAFLYAVNIGMITGHVPPSDAWGHLWTLAVEEQFYIVWPLVVWVVNSRTRLAQLSFALIVLGPLIRLGTLLLCDWTTGQLYVSSLTHLDAFAVGALLATHDFARVKRTRPVLIGALAALLTIGVAIALGTGTALRTLGYPEGLKIGYGYLWAYTPLNLCAGLLILCALRDELPGLAHPALAYLGRISYCVYLVQRPIKGIYLERVEPRVLEMVHSEKVALVLGAILCMGASIAVAAFSYRFFEAPILRWRDRVSRASSPSSP